MTGNQQPFQMDSTGRITPADLFAAAALQALMGVRRDLSLSLEDEGSRRRLATLAWGMAYTMLAVGEDGRIY